LALELIDNIDENVIHILSLNDGLDGTCSNGPIVRTYYTKTFHHSFSWDSVTILLLSHEPRT